MKRVKRLLAFLLAFTLVFGSLQSGVLTVAAEENEQTMEADAGDQPEGETPANEENQEEPAEAAADEATSDEQAEVTEAAKDDPETTNELEEVQSDESEEVAEEVEASEDDSQVEEEEALEENAEETEEESDEPLVFEVTQDGVTVRISGTADALAGVASVSVSKLSDEKIEVYEEAFAEDDTITASKVIAAYDITLLNEDGEAIEPDGSVSVTITSDVLQEYLEEGEDIQVLHDTNTTVEAIEDDSIDNETVSTDALEVLDIESDDSGSIAVTMDSFSTVLFALQASANNGTGEYTLTLADYAKSEFYDADVISSIAITEIGGETVTAGLKSYAANQGDEIVVTVTYKNGVTNAMAAVERSYTTASGATSKYVMPVTANEDGAACKTYGVEMPAGDTTISLVGLTYWEVTNTTLAITGSGKMPSFIASDETVYSPYHATYRDQVTTVTIGEGITRTGNYTCAWFTNLTELSLPDTLSEIGWFLVRACAKLESLEIPSTVTRIESGAFYETTSLKKISVKDDENAKENTADLSNVTTIGNYLFNKSGVENVILGDGVTALTDELFCNSSLKSVVMPSSITSIMAGAFRNVSGVSIYYCSSKADWDQIEIDTTNNSGLSNYTYYYYSESDPTAGEDFDPTLNYWHYVDGEIVVWNFYYATLYSQGETSYVYGGINEGTATVTLPDLSEENVEDRKTFVGWYSDIDCTTPVGGGAVQKEIAVQLTDSNAKYYAGWDAASYTATYVLNGGEADGTESDDIYTADTEYGAVLTAPEVTKTNQMLEGWYTDEDLTISYDFSTKVTKNITLYAKWEDPHGTWGSLTWAIDLGNGTLSTGTMTISGTGASPSYSSKGNTPWWEYKSAVDEIVVEESVTSIGAYAFDGMTAVTNISLPTTLVGIGQNCFNGMSALKTINSETSGVFDLRDTQIKTITYNTFNGCKEAKAILLPDTASFGGSNGFTNANGLIAVQIPSTVTNIGANYFQNCNELKVIYVSGDTTSWSPTVNSSNNSKFENAVKAYLNGGSLPTLTDSDVSSLTSTLLTPTKSGYIFKGWYNVFDNTEVTGMPAAATSIYAKWEKSSYWLSQTKIDLTMGYANDADTEKFTVKSSEGNITSGISASSNDETIATVNVTSNGRIDVSSVTGLDAGTYSTSITVSTPDGATFVVPVTLTVEPASVDGAVITLEETSYTYDGTAKTPDVTVTVDDKTLVEGTDYKVAYSSNTNAGDTTVTITGIGNYTGTKSATFTIEAAQPTLTFKDAVDNVITVTYDGNQVDNDEDVVAEVELLNGDEYTGTISYAYFTNANATGKLDNAPKDAGTYYVGAYAYMSGNYKPVSAMVTLVIEKAVLNLTLTTTRTKTYDGTNYVDNPSLADIVITYNGLVAGDDVQAISLSDNQHPAYYASGNLGSQTVVYEVVLGGEDLGNYSVKNDLAYGGEAYNVKGTGTVVAAEVTAPQSATYEYNGNKRTIEIPVSDAYTVTGDAILNADETMYTLSFTDAGSKSATLTLNYGYVWSDNSGDQAKTVTLTIEKATPTVSLSDVTVTYTGDAIEIGEINPSPVTVTLVNDETYDGSISYTYYSDEECTNDLGGAPTNVGTYYVKASIPEQTNYKETESEAAKLIIINADLEDTDVVVTGYTGVYDGKAHSITVTADNATITYATSENGTYSSEKPSYTDAGEYTVYYKVSKANCNDVTGSQTVKIAKAKQSLSYATTYIMKSSEDGRFTNALTKTLVDGALNYASSVEWVATVDSNGQVSIHIDGTTTITVTAAETKNYEAASASYTLKVYYPHGSHGSSSSDSSGSDAGASSVSTVSTAVNAQTGDTANPLLWAVIMLAALVGIGGATVYGRRKRKNI